MSDIKKDNRNLIEFWDNQFKLDEEYKKQVLVEIDKENDWKELIPSHKLLDACITLSNKQNILDYGCGNGWASIACAKSNLNCNIKCVDVSCNAVEQAKFFSNIFNTSGNISFDAIDTKWLESQDDNTYDGLICSNVLDVVPNEIAVDIIKETARITTSDALVIFSFNYYMDVTNVNNPSFKVEGNNVYINDVLRLVSLTDEEWINLFSKYYKVEKLEYFSWPGEQKETRRLFYLKKNK